MSEILHPTTWLNKINLTLQKIQCKIRSDMVSFEDAIKTVNKILEGLIADASTLWWIGNGGSAALCSHLSQDVLNKLGIRSMHLNDASLMSCMANDYGYKHVFSKPLQTLFKNGDSIIAISSSGNSANIINSIQIAQKKNLKTVTLSGFKQNNQLWNIESDVAFYLPCELYGIVEVGHEAILHSIIECLYLNYIKG
jgi:D-sedoheptulose 7-phosphate isomerase